MGLCGTPPHPQGIPLPLPLCGSGGSGGEGPGRAGASSRGGRTEPTEAGGRLGAVLGRASPRGGGGDLFIAFFFLGNGGRTGRDAGFLPIKEIHPQNPVPPPQPPSCHGVCCLPARGGGDRHTDAHHFSCTPALPPPLFFLLWLSIYMRACFLLLQHVEDPGINIPDQTVIKKGKPSPCAYPTCLHRLGGTHQQGSVYPGPPPFPPAPQAPGSFLGPVLLAERSEAEKAKGAMWVESCPCPPLERPRFPGILIIVVVNEGEC